MRADSSDFFTQPPCIINRLLSSIVTFLEIWFDVTFLRLYYIQYVCACDEDCHVITTPQPSLMLSGLVTRTQTKTRVWNETK